MLLAERLAGLQYSILPCWVYDHEMLAFRWANPAALQLWQAATLADFLARDVSKPSACAARPLLMACAPCAWPGPCAWLKA